MPYKSTCESILAYMLYIVTECRLLSMCCQAVAGGEEAGVGADIVGRLPELTGAKQKFSNVSGTHPTHVYHAKTLLACIGY